MYRKARTALFVLGTAIASAAPSTADVITDWNERTLPVVAAAAPAGRGPTPAVIIDIAMVHAAMYDAVPALTSAEYAEAYNQVKSLGSATSTTRSAEHFRFADTEARSQGRRVANHAFKNILQPIDKHGNK